MVYRVELSAIDLDGGRGRILVRFSPPASFSIALSTTMLPLIDAVAPIIDSTVYRIKGTWSGDLTGFGTAEPGANLQDRALFIIRSINDDYFGFYVPAPKASIFEDTGDYAGIRVKSSVCESLIAAFDAFPISDPLSPGIPIEIDSIVGMRAS